MKPRLTVADLTAIIENNSDDFINDLDAFASIVESSSFCDLKNLLKVNLPHDPDRSGEIFVLLGRSTAIQKLILETATMKEFIDLVKDSEKFVESLIESPEVRAFIAKEIRVDSLLELISVNKSMAKNLCQSKKIQNSFVQNNIQLEDFLKIVKASERCAINLLYSDDIKNAIVSQIIHKLPNLTVAQFIELLVNVCVPDSIVCVSDSEENKVLTSLGESTLVQQFIVENATIQEFISMTDKCYDLTIALASFTKIQLFITQHATLQDFIQMIQYNPDTAVSLSRSTIISDFVAEQASVDDLVSLAKTTQYFKRVLLELANSEKIRLLFASNASVSAFIQLLSIDKSIVDKLIVSEEVLESISSKITTEELLALVESHSILTELLIEKNVDLQEIITAQQDQEKFKKLFDLLQQIQQPFAKKHGLLSSNCYDTKILITLGYVFLVEKRLINKAIPINGINSLIFDEIGKLYIDHLTGAEKIPSQHLINFIKILLDPTRYSKVPTYKVKVFTRQSFNFDSFDKSLNDLAKTEILNLFNTLGPNTAHAQIFYSVIALITHQKIPNDNKFENAIKKINELNVKFIESNNTQLQQQKSVKR